MMALFAFTVFWENVTSLQKGAKFWESWEDTSYPKPSDILNQGLENRGDSDVDVDVGRPDKPTP